MARTIQYGKPQKRRIRKNLRHEDAPAPYERRESFFRPAFFVWVSAFLGLMLFVWMEGLPALRWQYQYQGPKSNPYYTMCDYISFHNGGERVYPRNGQCPLIDIRPIIAN